MSNSFNQGDQQVAVRVSNNIDESKRERLKHHVEAITRRLKDLDIKDDEQSSRIEVVKVELSKP